MSNHTRGIDRAVAAALSGAGSAFISRADNAAAGATTQPDKLDQILTGISQLASRVDSIESANKTRNDSAGEFGGKMDAAASKMDAAMTKMDGCMSKVDACMKRMDEEDERRKKEREDAEAKTRSDAEAATAAAAAAAAATAAAAAAAPALPPEVIARLDSLEQITRRLPPELPQDQMALMAGAQVRLDSAYQAWGSRARAPQMGESPRVYRVALLKDLQKHSKAYKDSDLATIGDEAAFSLIEAQIIADAISASSTNIVHGAPLRAVKRRNDAGHGITEFFGDPAVTWAPFMGGRARFGKIVKPEVKH